VDRPLVISDLRFQDHLPGVFHLESTRRWAAINRAITDPRLSPHLDLAPPRPAGREDLALVHTSGHLERLAATAGRPLTSFDPDTQATAESFQTARLAAGAVLTAQEAVLAGRARRAFVAVRPPGHHAEPDKAMGFCLLNNVAVGAAVLIHRHGLKRVMIVDLDLHHGNGTQAAFYLSRQVLYFSSHLYPAFPGTGHFSEVGRGDGEGFTVNVPLGRGQNDRDMGRVVSRLVVPLARLFKPEMILVSLGFDLFFRDPLAGMRVSPAGYALFTRLLLDAAEEVCGGRIVFVMEGGYSIRGIQHCGRAVLREMAGLESCPAREVARVRSPNRTPPPAVTKAIEIQRAYWDLT